MPKSKNQSVLPQLRKHIRKIYREKGRPGSHPISPGEGLRKIVGAHRRKPQGIPADIQLWLALFDEAAALWLVGWLIYRERITNKGSEKHELLVCLTALAGRAFQDMICIREMIEGGFFVQSNVVSRSLVETIDVMHLLNVRPELAAEFFSIKENGDASKFWHRHCSRGKIGKLVKARWTSFFEGEVDPAESFHGLRDRYMDLMGMSVHPSFGASFVTFMDGPEDDDDDIQSIAYNAMGAVSQMSKFTIHLILLRVFEYGLLWLGPHKTLYGDDPKSKTDLDENVSKGLSVLLSAVYFLDQEKKGGPFFPEFRTYWPRASFEEE